MRQQTLFPFVIIKYSWGLGGGEAGERGWQRRAALGPTGSSGQGRCCPFLLPLYFLAHLLKQEQEPSPAVPRELLRWRGLLVPSVSASLARVRGVPQQPGRWQGRAGGKGLPRPFSSHSESNKTKNNRSGSIIVNFFSIIPVWWQTGCSSALRLLNTN